MKYIAKTFQSKGTPARAIVRTGSGNVPAPDTRIAELDGKALLRSEEHTSELQSHYDLVCRLLLEKKK